MKSPVMFAMALAFSIPARAFILGDQQVIANFTNPAVAITNFTWSDGISLSTNGLGWDGEANAYKDFWVQTVPIAIGTSWRPATGVNITYDSATEATSNLYLRYSVDKKHWSSWQLFNGSQNLVRVPDIARTEYNDLFSQFRKKDVVWPNDEEAAVKWILEQQPDFFEKHQPFIGYIQFRWEGSMPGSHRIKRIHLDLEWGISGLQVVPQNWNPDVENGRTGPWRFETE